MESGIYQIRNLINNKIYIGSAKDLKKRSYRHLGDLNNNKHHSIYLQRSWNKHGSLNFVIETLEKVDLSDNLVIREQFYLDKLLFANIDDNRFNELGYNICRIAGKRTGIKLTESHIKSIKEANTGRFVSAETRKKLSLINKGKKWCSDEHYKKLSVLLKGPRIIQKDLDNIHIKEWDCGKEVERNLGLNASSIMRCCKKERKTAYGYKWEFKNNNI